MGAAPSPGIQPGSMSGPGGRGERGRGGRKAPPGPCLVRHDLHPEVGGLAHYHLTRPSQASLDAELAALPRPHLVSARVLATDVEAAEDLARRGFVRVCMLGAYVAGLAERLARPVHGPAQGPDPYRPFSGELLERHARNLGISNFSLDSRLGPEAWVERHRQCVARVTARPDSRLFYLRDGFASLRKDGDSAVIDLFSVLTPRRGTGRALMDRVLDWAGAEGLKWVEAVTERENAPACLFYQQCGFLLAGSVAMLHLVRS